MAIEFDCPHCKTHYRLKDEFGGKTATCKNPNCRKVIPIPKPTGAVVATAAPVDLDALAAAAFADDSAKADKPAEQMIQVACTGCDHTWFVEASKEGKNVRCPECGKVVRVPMRKKEEKADWRTGGGPTLAKRETGLDREGAFGTAAMGNISGDTAREIVKDRADDEEPEERRKRLIKRGVLVLVVAAVLGVGGYFAFQQRKIDRAETRMEDAVAEFTKNGSKDGRFGGLIYRASAESRIRLSGSADDTTAALNEFIKARNTTKVAPGAKGPTTDNAGVLADIAVTIPLFVGTAEQVDKGVRVKKDGNKGLVMELRQTVQEISDPELVAEVIRTVTRESAKKGEPTLAEAVARQRGDSNELIAQIGLELLRVNRDQFRGTAEGLLANLGTADTPGIQALRAALNKPAPAKKEGEPPPTPSLAATAEAEAIKGDAKKALEAAGKVSSKGDKAKALAAVSQTLIATNPTAATTALTDASKTLRDPQVQGAVSSWVSIRVCRLLGQVGQFDEAEALAASLPDEQAKAWGRLAALQGRLEAMKDKKGDDSWLAPIGDPTKLAAAAKAHEVLARHNAAAGAGGDYQAVVKKWPLGTVRPFGMAGIVLGQLDRDGK